MTWTPPPDERLLRYVRAVEWALLALLLVWALAWATR